VKLDSSRGCYALGTFVVTDGRGPWPVLLVRASPSDEGQFKGEVTASYAVAIDDKEVQTR
jgi:hypothetical protein